MMSFACQMCFLVLLLCLPDCLPLLQGQVQQNTPQASLLVNGQSGPIGFPAGEFLNLSVGGAPQSPVLLWSGHALPSSINTGAGFLSIWTPLNFLADGLSDPTAATDSMGLFTLSGHIPFLTPAGTVLNAQAAVQDFSAPLAWRLSAPSFLTVGPPSVGAQHLFFNPLFGAKGVPQVLPPAGTLPGDLPTLGQGGFPAPTQIFFQGEPVHGVFAIPFTCYVCHGQVPEIWSAYMGTMMANAGRDPLFNGQFSIAVADLEFTKSVGLTALGGELAADLCIRCHSPNGWQGGRSGFDGDGTPGNPFRPGIMDEQFALDKEGVVCDMCHRTTGFVPNISPTSFVLPGQPDTGQLVIATSRTKRGPYIGTVSSSYPNGLTPYGAHVPPAFETTLPPVPHNPPQTEGTSISPFHETEHGANLAQSSFCGTCHNVTNPLTGHAVERTYAEWKNSSYSNPASPDYKTCQDCHMPVDPGHQACTLAGSNPIYGTWNKLRTFFRKHEMVGGNAWIPQILKLMYPNVDQNWTNGNNYSLTSYGGPASRDPLWDAVTTTALAKLEAAAQIDLSATEPTPGNLQAVVRITNLTGHKLPTGYPEGRHMWIRIRAEDASGQPFFQSGLLDANNDLLPDAQLKVYESLQGLNYPSLGLSGPSFHFVLNNMVVKDNRIPPKGNVAIPGRGGTDSYDPLLAPWPSGGLYPDNQNWDDTTYTISVPATTQRPIKITATAFYQTSSFAYVSFLANGGDSVVQTTPHADALTLQNLWSNGHPAPAMPVGTVGPTSSNDPASPTPNSTAMVIIP